MPLRASGVESALLLRIIQKSRIDVPVITIDTGFWKSETHQFKDELADRFNLDLRVFSPSEENRKVANSLVIQGLNNQARLKKYNQITKLEPMARAVKELGVTALLSGVRGHQSDNRASLRPFENGRDGEYRVHPTIDWTPDQAESFFIQEDLPKHPLFSEGYASVGDWPLTRPGPTRAESRGALGSNLECGLHVL